MADLSTELIRRNAESPQEALPPYEPKPAVVQKKSKAAPRAWSAVESGPAKYVLYFYLLLLLIVDRRNFGLAHFIEFANVKRGATLPSPDNIFPAAFTEHWNDIEANGGAANRVSTLSKLKLEFKDLLVYEKLPKDIQQVRTMTEYTAPLILTTSHRSTNRKRSNAGPSRMLKNF